MDNNSCLNEILNELRKIRQELSTISRYEKELENIKYELKNVERTLERRNWK